jgi:C_GCAxxG_C_C family probable redox protein
MTTARSHLSPARTTLTFLRCGTCSGALCTALDRAFDHPLASEERAASLLAGGIMARGYQCGQLWGATLAAGAQAYRLLGPGPRAEATAIAAARRLVESFRGRNGDINCLELTDTDWRDGKQRLKYFIRGKPVDCIRMAARFAPVAFDEANAVFSGLPVEAPSPPVSCAALLARKMGASDLHVVMAAGLAGGIGLSGGACGALGAAVWLAAMNAREGRGGKIDFEHPGATGAVDRFVKCTGQRFECSRIAGRQFEGVDDHARHVRDGGCSDIIEALASG